MDMDNGVGIDYGSVCVGEAECPFPLKNGENWEKYNSINNKTFRK